MQDPGTSAQNSNLPCEKLQISTLPIETNIREAVFTSINWRRFCIWIWTERILPGFFMPTPGNVVEFNRFIHFNVWLKKTRFSLFNKYLPTYTTYEKNRICTFLALNFKIFCFRNTPSKNNYPSGRVAPVAKF